MALQTSGQISLNDIHLELGATSGTQVSLNDADVRGLIGKSSGAQNAMNEYYGAADETEAVNEGNINGQANIQEALVSDYISSGETFVIPSSFWLWSNSTSTAALTIDIPCIIKNYGKIIGKGGNGGTNQTSGAAGGPAIKINSSVSNVTITNYSGGYIAGGGGGGAGGNGTGGASAGSGAAAGGGGGAGGGNGGQGSNVNYTSGDVRLSPTGPVVHTIGDCSGGVLNASGSNGTVNVYAYSPPIPGDDLGFGGQAGGTGGTYNTTTANPQYCGGGGGGGRILPGVRRNRDNRDLQGQGGYGGAANEAGQASQGTRASQAGGGGGGWGAAGGQSSATYTGGAAGKAIEDSGNTYTLTNSGNIYGATT